MAARIEVWELAAHVWMFLISSWTHRVVVPSPRPLSICREAGQGVPLVYLPELCRRSARACGVAASTAGRHTVGRNPSRQGELVHHGGQQMC